MMSEYPVCPLDGCHFPGVHGHGTDQTYSPRPAGEGCGSSGNA